LFGELPVVFVELSGIHYMELKGDPEF